MSTFANINKRLILALLLLMSFSVVRVFSQDVTPATELVKIVQDDLPFAKILNEGYYISGRHARLVSHPDNKRWFLVFDKAKDKTEGSLTANSQPSEAKSAVAKPADASVEVIEILPSRWLETMLRVVNNTSDYNIVFKVWGNVTVYNKRNFIFLTMVATESLFGGQVSASEQGQSRAPFEQPVQNNQAAGTNPETVGVVPQQVRDKLLSVPRVEVVSFQFKMRETDSNTVTIEAGQKNSAFYNDMIITDRTGRLFPNQSEGRVYFMFESGDGITGSSQIAVHPCQLLEKMVEKAASTSGQNLKFRISGRIDEFKGEFFLMPTMYLQEGYRGM